MNRIGITQRVVWDERISERRDVLDQRWYDFADQLGVMLIPIPNNLKKTAEYVDSLKLDGVIFSGGNNISIYGQTIVEGKSIVEDDVAYERDLTESRLIEWSLQKKKPIIGVCRGMQLINAYFKGEQVPVDPEIHVAKEHRLTVIDKKFQSVYGDKTIVNSYHRWGITLQMLAKDLVAGSLYKDEQVEAFYHKENLLYGIMWHPERTEPFSKCDIDFFKKIFKI